MEAKICFGRLGDRIAKMRIIEPFVEILRPIDGIGMLMRLEECGRACYQSEADGTADGAKKFVQNIIRRGHESVLEHCSFTVRIICDRGVSHELVRHRLASYSQESTRYCAYNRGKFGGEIAVIQPSFWEVGSIEYELWEKGCERSEESYFALIDAGASAQQARAVLPNSLKTEITMTANLREWRHFFKLRCSKAAHPDMRIIAMQALEEAHKYIPVVFDDIYQTYGAIDE